MPIYIIDINKNYSPLILIKYYYKIKKYVIVFFGSFTFYMCVYEMTYCNGRIISHFYITISLIINFKCY